MPVMGRTNTRIHYPLWIALGICFIVIGGLGLVAAHIIETVWLHQDQRHRLVAPIQRTETA